MNVNSNYESLEQITETVKSYNKKSIHEFIFIFIISLVQIVFGGVFIEGIVNKELKEEDLVANLNVTSSFTIFIDVIFFMLSQKCYELHQKLVIYIYKHRICLTLTFLLLQLVSLGLITYFGIMIGIKALGVL